MMLARIGQFETIRHLFSCWTSTCGICDFIKSTWRCIFFSKIILKLPGTTLRYRGLALLSVVTPYIVQKLCCIAVFSVVFSLLVPLTRLIYELKLQFRVKSTFI